MKDKPDEYHLSIANIIFSFLAFAGFLLFCYVMKYPLSAPVFLSFFGIYLFFTRQASMRLLLSLGMLLTLIIFTTHFFTEFFHFPVRYIPVAGIAMLTMLLFNNLNLALMMSFACSTLVTIIVGGQFNMMVTFFVGALAGSFTVREARTRGQLISAGLFIGLVHIVCLALNTKPIGLFLTNEFAVEFIYPWAANGFISSFLVVATLKVFEGMFGVLTNYSLLELSDFNQPLLKRMVLEAPGTYHHSLVVSNLSESAADAIGASSLLTRVGAYYHDIGKMVKPEYFTENQLVGANKHDAIEPTMSRLVIFNHVKEGIELAKRYKLNQKIIDFIPQHHGTSLMYYFYQRALEEAEEGEVVNEENFRYPGPKPQTRETAITLLADSVEGAVRALDDPNPTRIEETVKKVINNKFIDGQLDECPLTLKEIDKITATFVRILSAMYHGRIKYPEKNGNVKTARPGKQTKGKQKDDNGDQNTRSAKEDTSQSPSNQKNRQDDS